MANDRADFAPEVRDGAWWATDSRDPVKAVLIKQGKMDRPDLSEVEAVQMGHVMQPVIGRLFSTKTGIEIRDMDDFAVHSKEDWLRSHTDFITTDGKALIEAKNYNAGVKNKFDMDTNAVPAEDYIQCLHEATVFNVDTVYLAVLLGGQEFRHFKFTFSDDEKQQFVQRMAQFWAYVKTNVNPPGESVKQLKAMYPTHTEETLMATKHLEEAIGNLKLIKKKISELSALEDKYETDIRNAMQQKGSIVNFAGETLITWRQAKSSMKFSEKLFQQAMPDIYSRFVVETPGSRRFLVK